MKKLYGFLSYLLPVADVAIAFLVYPAAIIMKFVRFLRIERLPVCKRVLWTVGVFPIRDHYYEPLFNESYVKKFGSRQRNIARINWNVPEQLKILDQFEFYEELQDISLTKQSDMSFYLNNGAFESGDAEYLYNLIRLKKPGRIFEIGSGHSTLLAMKAISKNEEEIPGYKCKHVCIEPYEMPWLEKTAVSVIRKKVEDIPIDFFAQLAENDILFIDSSHIIRPQGDVLFECLELLPVLNRGVIVHIHDIFSPNDYTNLCKGMGMFWNEQYLLEAFLMYNSAWKIIGALNYLKHNHYEQLKEKCPFLSQVHEPGSFYLQKID